MLEFIALIKAAIAATIEKKNLLQPIGPQRSWNVRARQAEGAGTKNVTLVVKVGPE